MLTQDAKITVNKHQNRGDLLFIAILSHDAITIVEEKHPTDQVAMRYIWLLIS